MGKTSKGRTHQGKSNYPYRTSRVGQHVHIIRPRMRRQGAQTYFIGEQFHALTTCHFLNRCCKYVHASVREVTSQCSPGSACRLICHSATVALHHRPQAEEAA